LSAGCASEHSARAYRGRSYLSRAAAVPPATLYDRWTTVKIRAKYALDYLVPTDHVSVLSRDGVVYLQGVVPDRASRKRAVVLARETEGVKRVEDSIKIVRRRTLRYR